VSGNQPKCSGYLLKIFGKSATFGTARRKKPNADAKVDDMIVLAA